MRISAIGMLLVMFCMASCNKKDENKLPANSWSVGSYTYSALGSMRTKSLPPQLLFFSDTHITFEEESISFTFHSFPQRSRTYKIVEHPMADDELSVYIHSFHGDCTSLDNSGTASVYVQNGKLKFFCTEAMLQQGIYTKKCTFRLNEL